MLRISILLLFLHAPVYAQDAGSALSTMVSTRTLRNTAAIGGDEAGAVDRLIETADKERIGRDYSGAIRDYQHAMAAMRGEAWTPVRQWFAALTLKPDHSVLETGQTLTLKLGQLFRPEALAKPVVATVSLTPGHDTIKTVELTADLSAIPLTVPDMADGNYRLTVSFGEAGAKTAAVRVQKGLMVAVKAAEASAAKLDPKLPELPSAQGRLARIEHADAGELGNALERLNLAEELREADAMLAELKQGHDPFAGRHGDLRKSYRSAVDDSLQPYRLFVPAAYDGAKPLPMIVLLHGMGGDENTMFESYGNGAFKKLAEQHGYVVACPKGRAPASMYLGNAERDVLDVLADVRRAYKIDPARIYMAGHSMGAYGTWSIAMDHPEMFTALGLISGGGDTSKAAAIAKIPQIVIHGDADPTVNVMQSRTMVAAEKKAGAEVKYMEIPGGNHNNVAVPAFEPIFEWFDSHKR